LAYALSILIMSHSTTVPASGLRADRVLVDKSERTMYLFSGTEILRTYRVSLGTEPRDHKRREGDCRTPEGRYTLDYKKENSDFFRAIRISYPNAEDLSRARRAGIDPGGAIMVHGQRNGFGWLSWVTQQFDWTAGCIAVTNAEMEEIWRLVDVGTPIEIRP
jgi:murein L,D-transpeptidase YafK